jgi:hypothetical protein
MAEPRDLVYRPKKARLDRNMRPFHSRIGGLTLTLYPGYLRVDWTGTDLTRWLPLYGLQVRADDKNLVLWYPRDGQYGYGIWDNDYVQDVANQINAMIAAH